MSPTTVKVDSAVRDQLMQLAAANGLTAGSMIEKLMEERLERELLAEAKRRIFATSREDMMDYLREHESLDGSLTDGLEKYAGEYDQAWSEILARDPAQVSHFKANGSRSGDKG